MLSRWRDTVFLREVSIGTLKKTRNWYFSYMSADFLALWSKNNRKKRGKPRLNARKHWESESINRNLSAAVLHVKPSCNNSNLNDIGISLQRADSGSYHFLVTGTKIIKIIWKLSENCLKTVWKLLENFHKIWWGETYHRRSAIESIRCFLLCLVRENIITKFEIKDWIKS